MAVDFITAYTVVEMCGKQNYRTPLYTKNQPYVYLLVPWHIQLVKYYHRSFLLKFH